MRKSINVSASKSLRWMLGVTTAMSALSLAAWAQEEPTSGADESEEVFVLEEVVVTAQRREQTLGDVPIAVSVLDDALIQSNNIRDVQDLALLAPSLSFTQSTNQLQSGLRLRGIGTQVFAQTVEPSVSFVVDGVVLARQGQALSNLIDIERVEVLRGPQGTLFGKNASAGVVNIVTKKPSKEFEGQVQALYAEGDEIDIKGTFAGPITEQLSGRLTGFSRNRDGHIENVFDGRRLNGNESWGVRGQLYWEGDNSLDLRLIADYSETRGDCCQWQVREAVDPAFAQQIAPVVAGPENDQTNVRGDVQADADDFGVSLEANYDLGNHILTSITAFRQWDFRNNTDVDSTPGITGGVVVFDRNGNIQQNRQTTQEIRLTSTNNPDFEYIVGLYYFDLAIDTNFERDITFNISDSVIIPVQRIRNINGVNTLNLSAFADLTWNASERLSVFGGLRLIYEELDFATTRDNLVSGNILAYDFERSADDTGFAGRAGFRYQVDEDFDIYGSYARSYKGIAIETAATAPLSFLEATATLDPETGDAFELGAKGRAFDGRLSFGAAIFYTRYDNFQAQALNPDTALAELFNVGSIETSGVEIDFTAVVATGLTLTGGVAYVDAVIDEFPTGPCFPGQAEGVGLGLCTSTDIGNFQDLAGGELPNAPDWKVNLNALYEPPVEGDFQPFIQASMVWQDEVLFSISQNPATRQSDYALVNASVGVHYKELVTATLFVRNLFDTAYANNIFSTPFGDALGTVHYLNRDFERYFGGTVTLRF